MQQRVIFLGVNVWVCLVMVMVMVIVTVLLCSFAGV